MERICDNCSIAIRDCPALNPANRSEEMKGISVEDICTIIYKEKEDEKK